MPSGFKNGAEKLPMEMTKASAFEFTGWRNGFDGDDSRCRSASFLDQACCRCIETELDPFFNRFFREGNREFTGITMFVVGCEIAADQLVVDR